jgi:hypothetical protein
MARIAGEFFLFHQDSQEFGSDDQHMVSRVYFRMSVDGRPPAEFYVPVKLAVGGNYLAADQLEIGRPSGYGGTFNHDAFAAEVAKYVRTCVGPGARGINFAPGSSVRMMDNRFVIRMPFEFEVPNQTGGTW